MNLIGQAYNVHKDMNLIGQAYNVHKDMNLIGQAYNIFNFHYIIEIFQVFYLNFHQLNLD
jgi:hypothetical protein